MSVTDNGEPRRVFYAGSVHGEAEIAAVVDVLTATPRGLWVGRRVGAMERAYSRVFRQGVRGDVSTPGVVRLLAVELLGCLTGDEIIASAVTFSTDTCRLSARGACRCSLMWSRDPTSDRRRRIEAMVTDRTPGAPHAPT